MTISLCIRNAHKTVKETTKTSRVQGKIYTDLAWVVDLSNGTLHLDVKLFPFQDGVLSIVKGLNAPFYLTGGTALSRCYFNHRYSDDIDLFVNNEPRYAGMVESVVRALADAEQRGLFTIDHARQRRSENYFQMFLLKHEGENKIDLKLELVNDSAVRYGELRIHPVLGRVDILIQ